MLLPWLFLAAEPPQFAEQVEVRKVVVQVRVLAADGSPVLGLQRDNVRIHAGGYEIAPEVVQWVSAETEEAVPPGSSPAPSPNLLVVFVQRDLQPARASGLLAFAHHAARVVESVPANVFVALLMHDVRLHLVQDFTLNHGQVADTLRRGLFRYHRYHPGPRQAPSLRDLLDEDRCGRAATPEQGLLLVARALAPLAGQKNLILLGWGLGKFSYPTVYLSEAYREAAALLAASRTPVFSLDITDADWHTLEVGLVQVADDTGGFYAKTHLFPEQAQRKLLGALAGFYEVVFPRPPLPEGVHPLRVELVGVEGTVLCPATFADPPSSRLP